MVRGSKLIPVLAGCRTAWVAGGRHILRLSASSTRPRPSDVQQAAKRQATTQYNSETKYQYGVRQQAAIAIAPVTNL